MIARITTLQVAPDRFEENVRRVQENTAPAAKQQSGFKRGLWFADRQSNRVISVTLWENEAALQANEAASSPMRAQMEQTLGAKIVSMEQFEVIGEAS
jgi:heme-degrading monooxygenase HmoA